MLPRANLVISASLWVQGVHALRCAAAQLNGRRLGARQFLWARQPAHSDAPSPEHEMNSSPLKLREITF